MAKYWKSIWGHFGGILSMHKTNIQVLVDTYVMLLVKCTLKTQSPVNCLIQLQTEIIQSTLSFNCAMMKASYVTLVPEGSCIIRPEIAYCWFKFSHHFRVKNPKKWPASIHYQSITVEPLMLQTCGFLHSIWQTIYC